MFRSKSRGRHLQPSQPVRRNLSVSFRFLLCFSRLDKAIFYWALHLRSASFSRLLSNDPIFLNVTFRNDLCPQKHDVPRPSVMRSYVCLTRISSLHGTDIVIGNKNCCYFHPALVDGCSIMTCWWCISRTGADPNQSVIHVVNVPALKWIRSLGAK